MDAEPTTHISEREKEHEKLFHILEEVSVILQQLIDQNGIDRNEGQLRIDERYLDLLSQKNQAGEFRLWGKLLERGHMFGYLSEDTIAQIQNIQIPEAKRKQRFASSIISTWEKELTQRGINTFIVTNIKDLGVVDFWKKQGYQVPETHITSNVPYMMFKRVSPEENK